MYKHVYRYLYIMQFNRQTHSYYCLSLWSHIIIPIISILFLKHLWEYSRSDSIKIIERICYSYTQFCIFLLSYRTISDLRQRIDMLPYVTRNTPSYHNKTGSLNVNKLNYALINYYYDCCANLTVLRRPYCSLIQFNLLKSSPILQLTTSLITEGWIKRSFIPTQSNAITCSNIGHYIIVIILITQWFKE